MKTKEDIKRERVINPKYYVYLNGPIFLNKDDMFAMSDEYLLHLAFSFYQTLYTLCRRKTHIKTKEDIF